MFWRRRSHKVSMKFSTRQRDFQNAEFTISNNDGADVENFHDRTCCCAQCKLGESSLLDHTHLRGI